MVLMARTGVVPRDNGFIVVCRLCSEEFDSLLEADKHRDECGGRVFDAKRKEEPKDEGKLTWRPPTVL